MKRREFLKNASITGAGLVGSIFMPNKAESKEISTNDVLTAQKEPAIQTQKTKENITAFNASATKLQALIREYTLDIEETSLQSVRDKLFNRPKGIIISTKEINRILNINLSKEMDNELEITSYWNMTDKQKICYRLKDDLKRTIYSHYDASDVEHVAKLLILYCLFNNNTKVVVFCTTACQTKQVFHEIEKVWNNAPILRGLCDTSNIRYYIDNHTIRLNDSIIIATPMGDDGHKVKGLISSPRLTHYLIDDVKAKNEIGVLINNA